jgi:hypothetical protein
MNPWTYTPNPTNRQQAQANINYWWFEGMGACPEGEIEANWRTFIKEMQRDAQRVMRPFLQR